MTAVHCGLLVALVVAQSSSYPPPFPRAGATKMLDNDRVQVWNVAWPKGSPTALHRHPYDMTGIYYAPGDRVITQVDGSKRPVTTAAGGIVWQFKGLTHIEEGTSEPSLRAVMIELKQDSYPASTDAAAGAPPAFPGAHAKSLLDNQRVAVWEYTRSSSPHRHTRDAVVVWLDGPTPHAVFTPRGTVHDVEAIGSAAKATVFELKEAAAGAGSGGAPANEEAGVRAVERLWNDARAKADVATLDRILVDEWTVTHANGTTDSKARYLADLKSGTRKFTGTVEEKDVVVRFYGNGGDTAIVTGSSDSTVALNGQAQGGALHFTRVFVKRNGSWVMVVTQATTRQP
jgi:quercetin dioxygenase-like cupin family protein/ketosteroid isomerase-like protein